MGQAGSRGRVNQGGRRVAALKSLQYKSDGVPSALKLLTRAVRLLHHLMKTIVADKISFQSRSLLVTSVGPLPGEVGADDQEACQESAAARMAILAVTLLTAFAINASPDADVKELIRATWRVVHMAEGCIQDASMLQALQACRQAAKVGEMLPALLQVSYRLSSGLTEVSIDRQVPFDRLPTPAPGLKTADPEVRALLALANATCIPYTADKLKAPAGDVRKLLLMPDEKEVASFTASTDTGAKLAAAVLFIQEEWRAYRHRQLVAAKIRWLRASRLWREKFHSWTLSMRAKKRLQKETEAVAALEERRKQYQANAQQRLAWVEEGLSQRLTEDSTCPVCRSDAGKKAAAAKSRLAEGSDAEDEDEEDEDDEDDEEQSGNNPFAALAGLQKAANAAPFVPHTQREYHEASLRAFQSYKHFYTDQVVPMLAEQKDVEAALQKMEPKAAQDAEVQHPGRTTPLTLPAFWTTCALLSRRQIGGCKQMRPKRWCLTVVCRLTHLRSMCAVMPSQMLPGAPLPRSKQLACLNTAGMRKKMTSWVTMTSLLLSRKRRREVQGRAQPEGVFESSSRIGPLQAGT